MDKIKADMIRDFEEALSGLYSYVEDGAEFDWVIHTTIERLKEKYGVKDDE